MAHGVKYRIAYLRKNGGQTTIDILERDYVSAVTSLQAAGNPLTIKWEGDPSDIYKPTIGSGATIRVVTTPLLLLDLYTEDPQKYIVKIYKGVSGSILRWQGFINADIYGEGISNPINSEVSIQCNDGMQLLDNIFFKESDGSYYESDTTLQTIFNNILSKLEISFVDMYNNHSLLIADGIEELLLFLEQARENYVDEGGNAMSCRQALDSIMSSLGLVMFFKGSYVYMFDPIDLHNFDQAYWCRIDGYSSPTDSHDAIEDYLDISNGDLLWGGTNSQLDVIPTYNEVVVKYDPYNFQGYDADFGLADNIINEGLFEEQSAEYWLNSTVTFKNWTLAGGWLYGNFGLKEQEQDSPIYGLAMDDTGGTAKLTIPLSNVCTSTNLQLRLTMEVYVQTMEDSLNIYTSLGTPTTIHRVTIPVRIKVGSTYITGVSGDYDDFIILQEDVAWFDYQTDHSASIINDSWTKASKTWALDGDASYDAIHGDLELEILDNLYDYFDRDTQITPWQANQVGQEKVLLLIIKGIKIEIINKITGEVIGNEGVEDRITLSTNLTGKRSFDIELTSGTGPFGVSRGSFKTDQQPNTGIISGLYRAPKPEDSSSVTRGTKFTTSKLLLQSVISQYKYPRFKINGTFNVTNVSEDFRVMLIKYSDFMGTRAFFPIKGTYNDREETLNTDLIEIVETREALE